MGPPGDTLELPFEAARNIYTVSALNREVRRLIEDHLGTVWVQGEISNILYEDVTLHNASSAIQVSANYGSWAVSCPYCFDLRALATLAVFGALLSLSHAWAVDDCWLHGSRARADR